jgi:hypothetical protein
MDGMQQITRYTCPIDSCGWVHDDPGPFQRELVEAGDPHDVVRQHFLAMEDLVREHLETHSLLEWAQEVDRLKAELRAAVNALRMASPAAAR